MRFLELLVGAEVVAQSGNPTVTGVEYDSRQLKPGNAFVAMRGESSDGNRFIDQAIAAGAAAVVTDSDRQPAGVASSPAPTARAQLRFCWSPFCGPLDGRVLSWGRLSITSWIEFYLRRIPRQKLWMCSNSSTRQLMAAAAKL